MKDIEQEAIADPAKLVKPHYQDHGQHPGINVLLGDIGGTNMRLHFVEVTPGFEQPTKEFKKATLKVEDYPTFEGALTEFLKDLQVYPRVAVLAIAGPVK